MKTVGIITEYNPFHHGHHFQLQRVRELTGADVVIVLMSGNIVQRGEFAIIDKWHRSEIALELGADLVLELPLLASLQSADYFADTGVELLIRMGCTTIAFGTETASAADLIQFVDWTDEQDEHIQLQVKRYLKKGLSYAAAYQSAIEHLTAEDTALTFNPTTSNHLLAIQYVRANKRYGSPLEILAIQRIKTSTEWESLKSLVDTNEPIIEIASGSKIRAAWWDGQFSAQLTPSLTTNKLQTTQPVRWEDYWALLRYQLMSHSPESLRTIFGIKEGIEHLLLDSLDLKINFDDYCQRLISKRWTRASIQRILLAVLLNIHEQEWENYRTLFNNRPLLRILGYNRAGRKFLRWSKEEREVELFSNFSKHYHSRYALTVRADRILCLNSRVLLEEQTYLRYPIQMD